MSIFSDIRYYFSVYRSYIGRRLYLIFALTILAALAEGFGIALLLPLIEAVEVGDGDMTQSAPTAFLREFLHLIGIGDSMVGILLFIGAVFLAKGALKFAEGGYASYLSSQLMREIKAKMFDAYSTMDYSYYSRQNTGHFVNIINGQINDFIKSFESFSKFLATIIITASYLAIAFLIAWNFALMALAAGVVLLFFFRRLNKFVHSLSRRSARESSRLNKFLVQSLQSFKYITATAQMDHMKGNIFDSIRKLAGYIFRKGAASAFTRAIKEPVSVIFMLFVIIVQVAVFDAPIAPIFVALILFHRGMQHMILIQDDWQNTMSKIGSLEMVVGEFEKVAANREPDGEKPVGPLSGSIRFDRVSFAYKKSDGDVLRGVSLEIPAFRTVAFVGESGAGKSTLIDMLTLMLRPQSGEIYIDGVPGSEIERRSWRSQIGYVSQETSIFDDTVANNITLWKGDYDSDPEVRERVGEAARKACASDFIEALPRGYATVVGDRGIRLSGGQRQRLFIARELYKNPNLLILDEATSALDSESEQFIQQSIDALKGSMTVVIIAHRLSTIRNADYIYVMENGEVIERGTYGELADAQHGRFRKMVQIQRL